MKRQKAEKTLGIYNSQQRASFQHLQPNPASINPIVSKADVVSGFSENDRAHSNAEVASASDFDVLHSVTAKNIETRAAALTPILEKNKKLQNSEAKKPRVPGESSSNAWTMTTVFGHLPELDWTIEAERRRLQINPEGMLLPWIRKTVEEGRKQDVSFSIDGLHLRLEYLPWTDCFVTNLSEEVLYTVMTSRFGLGELSIKHGDVIEDDLQDGLGFSERIMTAEDLLCLAGLWTVQGRILPGDDPTRPRRLKHAPDCLIDIAIPEVHAVIDLWQSRPMSAFEIISELNISQRYVFGVMAAATTAMLFEF